MNDGLFSSSKVREYTVVHYRALNNGVNALSFTHPLMVVPRQIIPVIECLATEAGYAVGDEVTLLGTQENGSGQANITVAANSRSVYFTSRLAVGLNNRTTGAAANITEAKWRLKLYLWA